MSVSHVRPGLPVCLAVCLFDCVRRNNSLDVVFLPRFKRDPKDDCAGPGILPRN